MSPFLPLVNPFICQIDKLKANGYLVTVIDSRTSKMKMEMSTGALTFEEATQLSGALIHECWKFELMRMAREN